MRTSSTLLGLVLIPGALALGAGCGSGNAMPDVSRMACEEIAEACEPDPGSGPIHDCHVFGDNPANTHAICMTREAECFRTCAPPTDGGTDAATEAGADAATDAATDASTDAPRDATTGG